MKFLAWLFMGFGSFLTWTAITNRSPLGTAQAVLAGQPVPPRASWRVVGGAGDITGGGGSVGRAVAGAVDALTGGTTPVTDIGGARSAIVAFARAQIGERYVFGAAGPETWDCSGLTMRAYEQVGIKLPHNAAMQQLRGLKVSSPEPGDIVFWGTVASHCGIYAGGGNVVHAPRAGRPVTEEAMWGFDRISYRRYMTPAASSPAGRMEPFK